MVFDETIHGFNRTPGLLAEALRFPMVLAVLQGLLLLGLVLWAGMGRFGKPLPAAPGLAAGKEVLIGNTAKLLADGGHAADSAVPLLPADDAGGGRATTSCRPTCRSASGWPGCSGSRDGHGRRLNLAALESGHPAASRGAARRGAGGLDRPAAP